MRLMSTSPTADEPLPQMSTFTESEHDQIRDLLVGRKVTKVTDDTLQLDDGRLLTFVGHEGGCSCRAGDYELTELNDVDNVITSVTFEDSPSDDLDGDGHYRIFVFAEDRKVNLATFEGSDGNGFYGTGYSIHVRGSRSGPGTASTSWEHMAPHAYLPGPGGDQCTHRPGWRLPPGSYAPMCGRPETDPLHDLDWNADEVGVVPWHEGDNAR
jgi:hypothetical protein